MRIIEGLQSQKPYKSSPAWVSVISEMLAKVIIDEGKLQVKQIMNNFACKRQYVYNYITFLKLKSY